MKEKIVGKYCLLEEKIIKEKNNNSNKDKIDQYKVKILT